MPDSPVIPDLVTQLECGLCSRKYSASKVAALCQCGGPLLVRYDLGRLKAIWPRDAVARGPNSMWRYAPVLPVRTPESTISMGEGMTPLLRLRRIGSGNVFLKDEGLNPTGSFEARGLSCAVSMSVELGIRQLSIGSGGDAASALAAYAAAAGLEAYVFVPRNAPQMNYPECNAYGAKVSLPDGVGGSEYLDLSSSRHPWRVEGGKTLGYEIAEQLGWKLPDALLYPAGCEAGMGKAFEEMEALGWIGAKRPQMIAATLAISLSDAIAAGIRLAAQEGFLISPEGATCFAEAERLLANGALSQSDRIVVCNTTSGLKYSEAYSTRFPRTAAGETDKLGGLITPR